MLKFVKPNWSTPNQISLLLLKVIIWRFRGINVRYLGKLTQLIDKLPMLDYIKVYISFNNYQIIYSSRGLMTSSLTVKAVLDYLYLWACLSQCKTFTSSLSSISWTSTRGFCNCSLSELSCWFLPAASAKPVWGTRVTKKNEQEA